MSPEFTRQGDDLIFAIGPRTYSISGFAADGGGIRATVTARHEGKILARDTLLLSSARRRQDFAGKLNGDAKTVEDELLHIEDALRGELAARQQAENTKAPVNGMDDPVPWPDSVDGNGLLQELLEAIRRFVILPKHADVATALWVIAAHAHAAWDVFPILAATSPTKRCGKTTLLDVLSFLLPRPLLASNISPASVYRAIEAWHPCLLVDEADTFLPNNDELRGVVNSSHNRSAAFVLRVEGEGEDRQVVAFSTWCPKVIAGIGALPATLEDRAICLRLRRKGKTERTERARRRTLEGFRVLSRQASHWAEDNLPWLEQADPSIPNELDDRAADNWQPLLAVADLAGGQWPALAQKAALALSAGRDADDEVGVRLLRHIKAVFEEKKVERIASVELVSALIVDEEWGWSTWWRGKALHQRGLAKLLAPFGIGPKGIRLPSGTPRGYEREQFLDAFSRYLGSDPQQPQQMNTDAELGPLSDPQQRGSVADRKSHVTIEEKRIVAVVADKNRVGGAMQQEAELF
jgi:putative DNA primase/helicase